MVKGSFFGNFPVAQPPGVNSQKQSKVESMRNGNLEAQQAFQKKHLDRESRMVGQAG